MKVIYVVTLLLVCIGMLMIYSTSAIHAWELYEDQYFFLKRQMLWAGIGLAAMLAGTAVKLELIRKNARNIFLFTVFLLVLVLFPSIGTRVGGARRWLSLGGISLQPAEFAKISLLLYSALLLSRRRDAPDDFVHGVLPVLSAAVLVCGLVVMQPDFGSAVILGSIVFVMMFIGGIKMKHLFGIGSAAIPALVFLVVTAPYRLRRIFIFLNPWEDPRDSGYQIVQSFLAIGSGGLTGRGLGQSVQKLYYLPESYTDFIFSIIGEEAGFLGAVLILALFSVLVFYGFKVSGKADNKFAMLTGFGVSAMIAIQCIIHIGVVTGCLPTKGLPLPFISFGGSSLIAHMLGAGLLANVSRNWGRGGG